MYWQPWNMATAWQKFQITIYSNNKKFNHILMRPASFQNRYKSRNVHCWISVSLNAFIGDALPPSLFIYGCTLASIIKVICRRPLPKWRNVRQRMQEILEQIIIYGMCNLIKKKQRIIRNFLFQKSVKK